MDRTHTVAHVDKAQLLGVFFESIAYGIHLVFLGFSLRSLLWREGYFRRNRDIHWAMVGVAIAFFVFSSLHWSLGIIHTLEVFVLRPRVTGMPDDELYNMANWINITGAVCVCANVLIGDAMLIYRCWIVYLKAVPVIIFPAIIWAVDIACVCVLTWKGTTLPSPYLVTNDKLRPFALLYAGVSIAQNVITTGLIVYRIRHVDRESAKFRRAGRRTSLQSFIRTVIESGLLYTTFAIAAFVGYLLDSDVIFLVSNTDINVIGIAFDLIIIRANRNLDPEVEYSLPQMTRNGPIRSLPLSR